MQPCINRRFFEIVAAASILVCLPGVVVAAQPETRPGDDSSSSGIAAGKTGSAAAARFTLKDPEFLEQFAATRRFSNGRPTGVHITRAGDAVLFLRSGARSSRRDLYEFNVATGAERVLATAAQLLGGAQEKLSAAEKARRERMRLSAGGIASFEVSEDGKTVLIPLSGKLFLFERETGKARELPAPKGDRIDARLSPDGKSVAFVLDGDLHVVIDLASGAHRRLTTGATPTLTRGLAEFVAQEEMERMHGYWWSPDSKKLVYEEADTADVEEFSIPDPSHPERPPQTFRYPRPGKNNARVRLGIIAVTGGKTTWIDWDHAAFPYLARVVWEENAPLVILVQNREQTLEVLYEVDPSTGHAKELLREADDAWINLDGQLPKWRRDGKSFLWSTERRGGRQLELHNRDGSLARVLTPVELNYRHLLGVDESAAAAWIAAGEDPTQTQIDRVSLDKETPAEQLTKEPGEHSALLSEESGVSVRGWQSLTSDAKQVVYRRDGSVAGELKSVALQPPLLPTVELTTVGERQFHAAIIRPHDFQPGKRYPVFVSVYAGPHAQMVTASRSSYLIDGWFAEQGFIVVSIDGRGTPARGRAWERAIKNNLIEVPLADQVAGLQALGAKYPELDLTKVGIFGWSFGGYFTASAVTRRPDIYHCGVAGAPVTDWLDYDTHYTERYLGVPTKDPRPYEISSVLNVANQLRRPLLVIHGTADDNVYFLHSIRLANAFFRAGREFNFLPLAGQTHMVAEPTEVRELYSRIASYFLEQLAAH